MPVNGLSGIPFRRTPAVEKHVKDKNQEHSTDAVWVQMCLADELDPQKRLAARLAILRHAEAQDCTLYRPDDEDESDDAEELDLGDARRHAR